MRLIDADALYDDIQCHWRCTTCRSSDVVKRRINRAPTIAPVANWTPCSVALPEDVEIKVVTLCYINETQVAYFLDGQWYTTNDQYIDNETIIAWQPLPEPYRGEA